MIEENECICNIVLVGVDSEVVSPNKEVLTRRSRTSKYIGKYRIARTVSTLTKDASELIGEVQVILKKQE